MFLIVFVSAWIYKDAHFVFTVSKEETLEQGFAERPCLEVNFSAVWNQVRFYGRKVRESRERPWIKRIYFFRYYRRNILGKIVYIHLGTSGIFSFFLLFACFLKKSYVCLWASNVITSHTKEKSPFCYHYADLSLEELIVVMSCGLHMFSHCFRLHVTLHAYWTWNIARSVINIIKSCVCSW